MKPLTIARIGIIAALYFIITYFLLPISFGAIQLRVAEGLTVLPILYPESIAGLFIGVLLCNALLGGLGLIDVLVGSTTTLIAAYITYRFRHSYIAYLSPIVLNAFIISLYLHLLAGLPYWLTVLSIGTSQALVVFGIGYPLIWYLRRYRER
ncbi:MAG: QueT transporter family protein [Firmicutes bacterium]|nr:QueT transporter family protein [Bacillota bacterium]